jgi:predicted membrane-bound spermidine synthase
MQMKIRTIEAISIVVTMIVATSIIRTYAAFADGDKKDQRRVVLVCTIKVRGILFIMVVPDDV